MSSSLYNRHGKGSHEYHNRRNFRHGLIFVNFGHTKSTEVYSAHAHAMPLEIVLHSPE